MDQIIAVNTPEKNFGQTPSTLTKVQKVSFFQNLTGNRDRNTIVKNTLDQPIIARFLRIYPDDDDYKVGLRLELYGCPIGE